MRRTLKNGLSDELVQALGLAQAAGVTVWRTACRTQRSLIESGYRPSRPGNWLEGRAHQITQWLPGTQLACPNYAIRDPASMYRCLCSITKTCPLSLADGSGWNQMNFLKEETLQKAINSIIFVCVCVCVCVWESFDWFRPAPGLGTRYKVCVVQELENSLVLVALNKSGDIVLFLSCPLVFLPLQWFGFSSACYQMLMLRLLTANPYAPPLHLLLLF